MAGFELSEPLLRILLLAIPVAVLTTLLAVLWARRRRRKTAGSIYAMHTRTMDDDLHSNAQEDAPGCPAVVLVESGDAGPADSALTSAAASAAQVDPAVMAGAAAPAPETPLARAPQDIIDEISACEERNDNRKLGLLYLELALAYRAAMRASECLRALQNCAGLAAMHGPPEVHAQARVGLAEAAFEAGDLTGACEQWQMAKIIYHDSGAREAYASVDKRMRANGCPTDWVLTDF